MGPVLLLEAEPTAARDPLPYGFPSGDRSWPFCVRRKGRREQMKPTVIIQLMFQLWVSTSSPYECTQHMGDDDEATPAACQAHNGSTGSKGWTTSLFY